MIEKLNKLPKYLQIIIINYIFSSIPIIIICVTIIILRKDLINYSSGNYNLSIGENKLVNKLANDNSYAVESLRQKLENLDTKIENLGDKNYLVGIEELENDIDSIKNTSEEIEKNSNTLNTIIEVNKEENSDKSWE